MKSQTTLIFLLFIILYGLPACREDRSIRPEILEVESIVDSLPEKALEMLKTEPLATGAASEAERMKMALLKNKAEDKLYVEHIIRKKVRRQNRWRPITSWAGHTATNTMGRRPSNVTPRP